MSDEVQAGRDLRLIGRWRVYTYRSREVARGYRRHRFVYDPHQAGRPDEARNCVSLTATRERRWLLAASVTLANGVTGLPELGVHLALPFVGELHFHVERIGRRLVRALGLEHGGGREWGNCIRDLGFFMRGPHLLVYLWSDGRSDPGQRRYYCDLKRGGNA